MSRRGWALARATGLALLVVALSPISPVVLVCVPLAVLLLAFHPRSPFALAVGGLLLVAVFVGAPPDGSPMWYAERAWALLLAGGFVLATVARRRSSLVLRGVVALGLALALVAALGALEPRLLGELDWWVGSRLGRAARTATELLGPGGGTGADLQATLDRIVEVQSVIYPAFLALASLATLSVAWYAVRRLEGMGEALAPLRDFRFSDQLIWILIGGLLLFLLPAGEVAARLGENAMVFMGGLYLLRGLAVLLWMGAALVTSTWGAVLWTVAAILFYPVVAGAAILLGVGDTWLDLRSRLRRVLDRG